MVKEHKQKAISNYVKLGIAAVILIALTLLTNNAITGKVSKSTAGENAVNFLNDYFAQTGVEGKVELKDVEKFSGLYQVNLLYNGEVISVYLTENGKYIIPQSAVSPISTQVETNTDTSQDDTDSTMTTCSEGIASNLEMNFDNIEELAYSDDGINLLKAEESASDSYGVSGSPTLIINGVVYSGSRTAEAYKDAICSAFKKSPSGCSPQNTSNIPKSDKPKVELFVMSFCPYGVQAETEMIPIAEFFGGKADISIRFIVSVNGDKIEDVSSLHGLYEAKEDARQLAIMTLYPDKYWQYLEEFNNNCYGGGGSSSGSCG